MAIVPATVGNARKVEILKEGYFAAKEYADAICQVTGTLLDVDHKILVANSEGHLCPGPADPYPAHDQRRGGGQRGNPDRLLPARPPDGPGDVRSRSIPRR